MIQMILSAFGNLFGALYADKLAVYRYEADVGSDGTTSLSKIPQAIYEGAPCRISFSQLDNPETELEDANPIHLQAKVFCATDYKIKAGDFLVVVRLDGEKVIATYRGAAGLPIVYPTHQEVLFAEVGVA